MAMVVRERASLANRGDGVSFIIIIDDGGGGGGGRRGGGASGL